MHYTQTESSNWARNLLENCVRLIEIPSFDIWINNIDYVIEYYPSVNKSLRELLFTCFVL